LLRPQLSGYAATFSSGKLRVAELLLNHHAIKPRTLSLETCLFMLTRNRAQDVDQFILVLLA
jgi:hypothetical protein